MQQVTMDEAKARLPELIDAVLQGESVTIAKDEQQAVLLVPFDQRTFRRQPGRMKGLIRMTEDFDAPLDDFKEYVE